MRPRWRVKLGGAVVLVLAAVAVAVLAAAISRTGTTTVAAPAPSHTAAPSGLVIAVHVLGAVERPGFYELRDGARVLDAIAAAGGLLDTADPAGVNLARFLSDGEQVRVPVVGEVPATQPGVTSDGLVNLNTADSAALETLPRVGPAMAARIIAWREANGGFQSVDDLRRVTGIGERTFAELAPLVTV